MNKIQEYRVYILPNNQPTIELGNYYARSEKVKTVITKELGKKSKIIKMSPGNLPINKEGNQVVNG